MALERNIFLPPPGNLEQTLVALIHCSEAGLNSSEIGTLLELDPRSFLSAFAGHEQIRREKAQGRFVYYGKDVYTEQRQRRDLLIMKARQPTTAEAIAILVDKIKDPALDNRALAQRLQSHNLFVDPETIRNLFVLHNLTEKNATFDLIRCLSEHIAMMLGDVSSANLFKEPPVAEFIAKTGSSIIAGGQDTNNPYVNFIQILLNSIPFFRM